MDLGILIIILNLAILAYLIWFTASIRNEIKNLKNIDAASDITLAVSQNQLDFFGKVMDKLNDNSFILEKFSHNQELKFEQLKESNSQNLLNLFQSISLELSKSINSLLELNKSELKSINEANKHNFEILNKTNQDRLTQIQTEIDKRLGENLQQNLKSFEEVVKNLGHIQSTAEKMINSTKSVEKLNSIFERTNSKGFGQFSETYLETMLKEHLHSSSWQKQISPQGSSDKIDFVVLIGDKKIGIDSKFPLTKYQDYTDSEQENKKAYLQIFLKSVVEMASDISNKYYKNGFIDSLFIYFPSDSMYNEVINNSEVINNLQKLRVIPVSPTTIFSVITLIAAYEFKYHVNENAENIIKGLQIVKKNILSFREEFKKLGDKIRQAQQNYDIADKNLITVQNTIHKLEDTSIGNNLV